MIDPHKPKVRSRMASDASAMVRNLKSEMEWYADYFDKDEQKKIKKIIKDLEVLSIKINGPQ